MLGADSASPTKSGRGLTKAQVQRIFESGFRVSSLFCRVLFLAGTGKVAFATSKSLGNTPRRNRVKRRFKAALQDLGLRIPTEIDVVIQISAKADRAPYSEIEQDLNKALDAVATRWASVSESS